MSEEAYREALARVRSDIEEAEAEEARLERSLIEARHRLVRLRQMRGALARFLGESDVPIVARSGPASPAKVRYADMVEDILRAVGAPMRIPRIIARMTEMGHDFGEISDTSRFQGIASAIRRRPHVFVRLARGLYGLAEWEEDGSGAAREADR